MKSNAWLFIILGILALVYVMQAGSGGAHALAGEPAPPVKLAMLDGTVFSLEEHRGEHIVLMDFWATWCGPCRKSMPVLSSIAQDYADRGVVFVAVNVAETEREVQEFLRSTGLDIPVAMDQSFQAARAYEVNGIPQTVIIDKQGVVQAVHVGAGYNLNNEIRRQLDKLLAGQPLVE